jgi:hypothetical protein
MPPNQMALYPNWLIVYVIRILVPMLMLIIAALQILLMARKFNEHTAKRKLERLQISTSSTITTISATSSNIEETLSFKQMISLFANMED